MNALTRLALYAVGLVVAFGAAFGIAGAAVPQSVVDNWNKESDVQNHENHTPETSGSQAASLKGLSLAIDGYVLAGLDAPETTGAEGELTFQIQGPDGAPVTDFDVEHERDLHLIVVRSDGANFFHGHPSLDATTGTWSIPWSWDEAGTYRVYADFNPAGETGAITLASSLQVGGQFDPVHPEPTRTDEVDGFTVTLDGDLTAGDSSELTVEVTRDGEAVTTLEPYLGAFGHLVALRQGDLAYLHVHAEGDAPEDGDTAGPDVRFAAEAPTAGRYLLYLDFQVDGVVHTAEFVLDAGHGSAHDGSATQTPEGGHDEH